MCLEPRRTRHVPTSAMPSWQATDRKQPVHHWEPDQPSRTFPRSNARPLTEDSRRPRALPSIGTANSHPVQRSGLRSHVHKTSPQKEISQETSHQTKSQRRRMPTESNNQRHCQRLARGHPTSKPKVKFMPGMMLRGEKIQNAVQISSFCGIARGSAKHLRGKRRRQRRWQQKPEP